MKIIIKLFQISLIFIFFKVGSWLQEVFSIPLPGSIVGLLLLWLALTFRLFPLRFIDKGAYVFLAVLPIFFIPATVGSMNFGSFLAGKGFLLIPLTIISTFLTMWVAGCVSQFLSASEIKRKEQSECK